MEAYVAANDPEAGYRRDCGRHGGGCGAGLEMGWPSWMEDGLGGLGSPWRWITVGWMGVGRWGQGGPSSRADLSCRAKRS